MKNDSVAGRLRAVCFCAVSGSVFANPIQLALAMSPSSLQVDQSSERKRKYQRSSHSEPNASPPRRRLREGRQLGRNAGAVHSARNLRGFNPEERKGAVYANSPQKDIHTSA
jgi:hypothetical protein